MKTSDGRERRAARRFPLQLKVSLADAPALTRDISTRGVFLTTRRPMAVGSVVQFALPLATDGGPLTARCRGRVVRLEPVGDAVGVAVAIESCDIRVADQAAQHGK